MAALFNYRNGNLHKAISFLILYMRTVFLFEWRSIIRDPLNIGILCFFIFSGTYSIYYGASITSKQLIAIDSLKKSYNDVIAGSLIKIKADTATRQGKIDFSASTEPASIDYRIKPPAIFIPNAFTALAIGQRDVLPYYKKVSTERGFTDVYDAEIANAELLALGNFDLSFVLIYLLPLLLIALTFNTYSLEKEQGTYALLKLQSTKFNQIIFYKLVFRTLLLTTIAFLLSGVGIYATSRFLALTPSGIWWWFAVLTSYIFFWSSICYLIISFKKSSAINAFSLLGIWLLLVIVIPSLINFYVSITHPIGIRADIVSEKRKMEEDVWAIKPKALLDTFYRYNPQYQTGNLADTFQYSPRRFAAYYDELERRLTPMANVYAEKISRRSKLTDQLSRFVPTLMAQKLFNQIGQSGLQSFLNNQAATVKFQKQWQSFIYQFIFYDKKLKERDYLRFPEFNQAFASQNSKSVGNVLVVFFTGLGFFLIGFYLTNKN